MISRHPRLDAIVREGIADGRLALTPLGREDAARSQDAGLRHRRDGLSVRLAHAQRKGRWTPPKRVAPGSDRLSWSKRWVYRVRETMSERSHLAFGEAEEAGDFRLFVKRMTPWMVLHDFLNGGGGPLRVGRRLLSSLLKLWKNSG